MDLSILAQGEAAAQGVGVLQTVISGGVPLILAVLCSVMAWVIYKLYSKVEKTQVDYRQSLTDQIGEASKSTQALTEALTKNTTSNERVEAALKHCHDTMARLNAELDRRERGNGNGNGG